MQAVAGKSVDELPLINWDEATRAVGGDEPDDPFLVDLIGCYYTEAVPRMKKLLAACQAYREGSAVFSDRDSGHETPPQPIELVIKEQAHAMKGSAANIRLWRIAKAAENVELPCKNLVQNSSPAEERKVLLDSFCVSPCAEVKQLVHEFRGFIAWVESDLRASVDPSVDWEADVTDEAKENLALMKLDAFNAALAPWAAIYGEGPAPGEQPIQPPAAAASPAKEAQPEQHQQPEPGQQPAQAASEAVDPPVDGSTPQKSHPQSTINTSHNSSSGVVSMGSQMVSTQGSTGRFHSIASVVPITDDPVGASAAAAMTKPVPQSVTLTSTSTGAAGAQDWGGTAATSGTAQDTQATMAVPAASAPRQPVQPGVPTGQAVAGADGSSGSGGGPPPS